MPESGDLLKYSARRLAELVRSKRPLEAGIGMATINALLDVDESACTEVNARELILERCFLGRSGLLDSGLAARFV